MLVALLVLPDSFPYTQSCSSTKSFSADLWHGFSFLIESCGATLKGDHSPTGVLLNQNDVAEQPCKEMDAGKGLA